jgi:predicted RNase H-like HicB family nuclease
MKKRAKPQRVRQLTVLIEQDEDGYFLGTVPALKSCYTQARTLEELTPRIREVIELCLAEQKVPRLKFVALQRVEVPA